MHAEPRGCGLALSPKVFPRSADYRDERLAQLASTITITMTTWWLPISKDRVPSVVKIGVTRRPARAPGRSSGRPCYPPGIPQAWACRHGSCPSGRRSCRPSSAGCSRPRLAAAVPETFNALFSVQSFADERLPNRHSILIIADLNIFLLRISESMKHVTFRREITERKSLRKRPFVSKFLFAVKNAALLATWKFKFHYRKILSSLTRGKWYERFHYPLLLYCRKLIAIADSTTMVHDIWFISILIFNWLFFRSIQRVLIDIGWSANFLHCNLALSVAFNCITQLDRIYCFKVDCQSFARLVNRDLHVYGLPCAYSAGMHIICHCISLWN